MIETMPSQRQFNELSKLQKFDSQKFVKLLILMARIDADMGNLQKIIFEGKYY